MVRVSTTILCDKNLKELAKARGIVLSTALEESLRVKLAMPVSNTTDINQKVRELENQLEYMRSAEFAAAKLEEENLERHKKEAREGDVKFIRNAFSKRCNQVITDEQYNKILKSYCLKYNCEMGEAVALSQSKNEPKKVD